MVELEKMHALIAKNFHNFDTYWIIKIFLVLRSVYMVFRDQDKVIFYINNYIN